MLRDQVHHSVVIENGDHANGMLDSDKSCGYCLEMLCTDFLAVANLDEGEPEILLTSVSRLYKILSGEQKHQFLTGLHAEIS